jgi:hypothetical protein
MVISASADYETEELLPNQHMTVEAWKWKNLFPEKFADKYGTNYVKEITRGSIGDLNKVFYP